IFGIHVFDVKSEGFNDWAWASSLKFNRRFFFHDIFSADTRIKNHFGELFEEPRTFVVRNCSVVARSTSFGLAIRFATIFFDELQITHFIFELLVSEEHMLEEMCSAKVSILFD